MIVNSQGFGHFTQNINNQDFAYETPRMLLVLDGCSGAKYAEVGVKLFAQLFSRKEEKENVDKFESNVKDIFDELIESMKKFYPNPTELEEKFIMENLLFTIIACFDVGDKYIVKMFGDGYIITQNMCNMISYMRFSYGNCPPYFAYTYCKNVDIFEGYSFKTFEFSKKLFKKVGIASDGILPIVKGKINIDDCIVRGDKTSIDLEIKLNHRNFYDDVTMAFLGFTNNLGGKRDEENKGYFSENTSSECAKQRNY